MRNILAFLFLFFSLVSNAEKYRLHGRVFDDSSLMTPVVDVSVSVIVDGKKDTTVVTNSWGSYSVFVPDSCEVVFSEFDITFVVLQVTPENIKDLTSKAHTVYLHELSKEIELDEFCFVHTATSRELTEKFIMPAKTLTLTDIKGIDASNISDVLEQAVPGVEFSIGQNGTPVMNLQGMGGKDVLFLVDGEKMSGETMDNIDYDRLELNNVKRIEVIKGAASILYPEAIGGVVNIVTIDPYKNKVSASFNYRNHNEIRANTTTELVSKDQRISSLTSLSFHNRDTYTLQGKDLTSTPVNVWGIKNLNVNEKLTIGLGKKPKLNFLLAKGGYYCETIDKQSYQGYNYFHQGANAGLKGSFVLNKFLSLWTSYYFDRYVKDYKYVDYDLPDKRKYENNRHSLNFILEYEKTSDLIRNLLKFGANLEYEYLLSDQFEFDLKPLIEAELNRLGITTDNYYYEIEGTPYKTHRQTTLNSCLVDVLTFKEYDFDLLYGLGLSSHSEYGAHFSPSVGLKKGLLRNKMTLRANYNRGARNPNMKERYMDYDVGGLGMFRIVGNKDLTTEKSDNVSLSVNYDIVGRKNKFKADLFVNGFYHNKKNCIEGQFNVRKDTMKYINVGEVQLYGFDACTRFTIFRDWMVDLNYTFLKDSYSNVTFTTNRPHSGTVRFSYRKCIKKKYNFDISLNGTIKGRNDSESYSYDANTGEMSIDKSETYPAYSVWKLNTTHSFVRVSNLELVFGIDNLFNYKPDRYDLVSCQSDGISLYGGVKYTF